MAIYVRELTKATIQAYQGTVQVDYTSGHLLNSFFFLVLGGYIDDVLGNRYFFDCLNLKDHYRKLTGDLAKQANLQTLLDFMPYNGIDEALVIDNSTPVDIDLYKLAGLAPNTPQPFEATLYLIGGR